MMWLYALIADGCAYLDGAESATNARRKDNNNPRTHEGFFYLNARYGRFVFMEMINALRVTG